MKPALDLAKARQFCLKPIAQPKPPPVASKGGPANPIDQFVQAKLKAAGMKPSPPADKPTLLRGPPPRDSTSPTG